MCRNEIVKYVFESPELDKMVKSICNIKSFRDDLKQEFLLILLEEKEDRLKKIYNEGKIWNWSYIILRNQWSSSTSPFYKKYRDNKMFDFELDLIVDEKKDRKDVIIAERVEDILKGIHWKDAHLFKLYYYETINEKTGDLMKPYTLRGIEKLHTEKDLKIDHVSIYLSVKKTLQIIKDRLEKEGYKVKKNKK